VTQRYAWATYRIVGPDICTWDDDDVFIVTYGEPGELNFSKMVIYKEPDNSAWEKYYADRDKRRV
jgi:hypothetical protein